jgi:tellurite resistance protein TehA-like permease
LRNFSGTGAALIQWSTQFAITKALPYIFSSFGYGTWYFFAAWMIVAAVWAFFLLPETKGLTIEQMDLILYVISSVSKLFTNSCTSGYNSTKPYRIPRTAITRQILAGVITDEESETVSHVDSVVKD